MGDLATAAQGVQLQAADPRKSIKSVLESQWGKIEAVMPKHMSSERLFQLAVSAINQTPKLAECTAESLLSCVMKCSALGIEPSAVDGLGRAYIIPRWNSKAGCNEATFMLGYKGMIALARRSGEIKDISARAVYEGDTFEYEFGLEEKLRHVPLNRQHSEGEKPKFVYCIAHFKDGGHYFDVMSAADVESVRKRSSAAKSGPWVSDYEAMAKKSVVRRAFPYLPVSVEAQSAAAADETVPDYRGVLNPVVEPVAVDAETGEVVEEAQHEG